MSMNDNDGQIIFGDLGGLKLPDICLTGEENPPKNLTQESCPDQGSNPGPLRDKRACYHLLHSGGHLRYCFRRGTRGVVYCPMCILLADRSTSLKQEMPFVPTKTDAWISKSWILGIIEGFISKLTYLQLLKIWSCAYQGIKYTFCDGIHYVFCWKRCKYQFQEPLKIRVISKVTRISAVFISKELYFVTTNRNSQCYHMTTKCIMAAVAVLCFLIITKSS